MSRNGRNAPGPRGRLLLGNLSAFRRDPIGLLLDSARRYGDIVRLRLGPVLAHLVNHPDYVAHVLQGNANYDKNTRSAAQIRATCGNGLLTTDGAYWRSQRRLVQPNFTQHRIDALVPVITGALGNMLDRWNELAGVGQPVDVVSEMMHLTFTIAGHALFSSDLHEDADVVERSLQIILDRTWHRVHRILDPAALLPVLESRQFTSAVNTIDRVVRGIIDQRRRSADQPNDLLTILLRARDAQTQTEMTDEQLRDETITLLLAAHETTANAISWALYLLSQSRHAASRLRDEIASVLGDRVPTLEDAQRLAYARMVFNETLRLYPSIWILERRVVADDVVGGYVLPRGSSVLICPFVLHRHPNFWIDPEWFDPERFTVERSGNRVAHAYIPFGIGPHQCVGQNLAMTVGPLVLAVIMQSFVLDLVPGHLVEPKPGITLRHRHGLLMTVRHCPVEVAT